MIRKSKGLKKVKYQTKSINKLSTNGISGAAIGISGA